MDCVITIAVIVLVIMLLANSRELYKVFDGKTYPDIKKKSDIFVPTIESGVSTKESCIAYCDGNDECKGFVLYTRSKDDTRPESCGIIKENVQEGNLSKGKGNTYIKGLTGGFEPVKYSLRSGSQLDVIQDTGLRICKAKCEENPECKALQFDKKSNTCILKKRVKKSKGQYKTFILNTD